MACFDLLSHSLLFQRRKRGTCAVILGRHFKFAAAFLPGKKHFVSLAQQAMNFPVLPQKQCTKITWKSNNTVCFIRREFSWKPFILRETKHDCYKNILYQLPPQQQRWWRCGAHAKARQPAAACLPWLLQASTLWQRGKCSLQKLLNCPKTRIRHVYDWITSLLYPESGTSSLVCCFLPLNFKICLFGNDFWRCCDPCVLRTTPSSWSGSTWLQNNRVEGEGKEATQGWRNLERPDLEPCVWPSDIATCHPWAQQQVKVEPHQQARSSPVAGSRNLLHPPIFP